MNAFHSTEYSGFKSGYSMWRIRTIFSGWLDQSVPGQYVPSFARKYEIIRKKQKGNSLPLSPFYLLWSCWYDTLPYLIFLTNSRVTFEWRGKLPTRAVMPTFHVAYMYFLWSLLCPIHCNNVETRDLTTLWALVLLTSLRINHCELDFQAQRNWARAGVAEWNGTFRLFRFCGL